MAYNDGWRVYEDTPVNIEKAYMLNILKEVLEKKLEKQQKVVDRVSEKTRLLTMHNSTPKRRSAANMRLSEECNCRDNIQRRIGILDEWIEEIRGIK